jgi:hypothetical protein
MASNVMSRSRWVLCAGGLAISCRGILGIEDVSEGIGPGMAGASGAGTGDPDQLAPAGSSPGGAGGSRSGGADTSSTSLGGSAGAAVTPTLAPPDGGAPEAAEPIVVTGHVIDFRRRPVPNMPVTIAGTTAQTNAEGEFSISGVEPPYTASLTMTLARTNGFRRFGYVYEGLTRADPTLQVYVALPEQSGSSLSFVFQNSFQAGEHAFIAFSTPEETFVDRDRTNSVQIIGAPGWTGPATITGNIHALLASGDPPSSFVSHQALPLTATNGLAVSATFNLAPIDIPTGNISGTASGGIVGLRSNYVAVRFSDGTAMPIIDQGAPTEPFSYVVPSLPGTSFVVAAADGSSRSPYAVAHRENVAFGQTDIALTVPRPVTLASPQNGASVTPSTTYSWSALGQTAQVFLWHLELLPGLDGMFVLTSRTEIELPEFADGFTVPPGTDFNWQVETHGDVPNVDACAGPNGYLDSFSLLTTFPEGPNRSDGYYTQSELRGFTMGED